eukprot:RCo038713
MTPPLFPLCACEGRHAPSFLFSSSLRTNSQVPWRRFPPTRSPGYGLKCVPPSVSAYLSGFPIFPFIFLPVCLLASFWWLCVTSTCVDIIDAFVEKLFFFAVPLRVLVVVLVLIVFAMHLNAGGDCGNLSLYSLTACLP